MFRAVFGRSRLATGALLSLAAHVTLAVAALVPLSGPRVMGRVDLDGGPPLLTIGDPDPQPVSGPVAAPAVAVAAARPAPAPPPVRRARRVPPPPTLIPPPAPDAPPAPPPPAAPPTSHLQAAPGSTLGQPAPPRPPYVSPGVAAGLRVYDSFPRMPDPLRGPGAHYAVLADVCVSDRGQVSQVHVSAPAGAAPLERALTDAIRTWRYRPLITRQGPSPFCHLVQMRYQLD
jgi:protein TonB